MKPLAQFLIKLACFFAFIMLWSWQGNAHFSLAISLAILIGGMLLVFPVSFVGRKILDTRPTSEHAARTNVFVHFTLVFILGIAIVEAAKTGLHQQGAFIPGDWIIPLPPQVGQILFGVTGVAVLLAVLNLAIRGLGAPFAIALSQRLAMDWLYAWTRNPMVLGTLLCLVSMGLMFRSLFLVLWALLLVTPALIFMLKVYEERELEIRFGSSYLDYKRKTPFLWPRKPGSDS